MGKGKHLGICKPHPRAWPQLPRSHAVGIQIGALCIVTCFYSGSEPPPAQRYRRGVPGCRAAAAKAPSTMEAGLRRLPMETP